MTFVRVWLRCIIGHLLVGQELYGLHEVPVSMSVIGGKADTNCQDGRGS
jgi:hypothetical protein